MQSELTVQVIPRIVCYSDFVWFLFDSYIMVIHNSYLDMKSQGNKSEICASLQFIVDIYLINKQFNDFALLKLCIQMASVTCQFLVRVNVFLKYSLLT